MISPDATVGLAIKDPKVRMALEGLLRSLGLACTTWDDLGDVVMGVDHLDAPLEVLFFRLGADPGGRGLADPGDPAPRKGF